MSETWKAVVKTHRGARQKKMETFLKEFYELHCRNMYGGRFTLECLMNNCGMERDYVPDYQCAMAYLGEQRKLLCEVVGRFFSSEDHRKHRVDGMDDGEMFEKLMRAAVSWKVYPVMTVVDERREEIRAYRLMTLKDFVRAKKRRMTCIVTEVGEFVTTMEALKAELPEAKRLYGKPPELIIGGVFKHVCEKCGKSFMCQDHMFQHYKKYHQEED